MGVLRVKPGVEFTVIAPGGFRILSALDQVADKVGDLEVTSGTDGEHSGPTDPHKEGKAYDVHSHGLSANEKITVLAAVMTILGWARFYGFLESPNTENEHFHFQVKKGTQYP